MKASEGHPRECVVVVCCSGAKENTADLQEFANQITSMICCAVPDLPCVCGTRNKADGVNLPSLFQTLFLSSASAQDQQGRREEISPQRIALPTILRSPWKTLPMWSNCVNEVIFQHFCQVLKSAKCCRK